MILNTRVALLLLALLCFLLKALGTGAVIRQPRPDGSGGFVVDYFSLGVAFVVAAFIFG